MNEFARFPITFLIIAVTCAISFLAFNSPKLKQALIFYPFKINRTKGEFFRFLTHGFIHANGQHLIFNMMTLYFFGPYLESYLKGSFGKQSGAIIYIGFFLLGIIVSSILSYFRQKNNQYYASLGASGAISAVLFASILINPLGDIWGIPSFIFGPLYLAYTVYMDKRGKDNIGHDAHFMGAIFGLIAIVLLVPNTFPNFIKEIITFFN